MSIIKMIYFDHHALIQPVSCFGASDAGTKKGASRRPFLPTNPGQGLVVAVIAVRVSVIVVVMAVMVMTVIVVVISLRHRNTACGCAGKAKNHQHRAQVSRNKCHDLSPVQF
jgi:hypothetical protein